MIHPRSPLSREARVFRATLVAIMALIRLHRGEAGESPRATNALRARPSRGVMIKIAGLDDCQDVARGSADGAPLASRAELTFFADAFETEDAGVVTETAIEARDNGHKCISRVRSRHGRRVVSWTNRDMLQRYRQILRCHRNPMNSRRFIRSPRRRGRAELAAPRCPAPWRS